MLYNQQLEDFKEKYMVLRQVNNDKPKPQKQAKNKSSKIKNYICPTCKLQFDSAKRFAEHCDSHVTMYPFECYYCKRRFAEQDTMKEHLQREHISGMEFK